MNIPHAIKIKREEEGFMTDKEREHQLAFEKKRKMHYNEFLLVKQARERQEQGLDDDDDDEDEVTETGKPPKGKPPDAKAPDGKAPESKAQKAQSPAAAKKPSPSTK